MAGPTGLAFFCPVKSGFRYHRARSVDDALAQLASAGAVAMGGGTDLLVTIDAGPCWAVHPSDPAVALTALDAMVEVTSTLGGRLIAMSDFYVHPSEAADRETVLQQGELVTGVILPAASAGGRQYFEKL